MKPNYTLQKTQKVLWQFITSPEGVAKALEQRPDLELPVRGDSCLSAVTRLDIYANMYFYRILDSLKEDFSNVLKVIGEEFFHNLITDYLLKYFPTHWSLRYAGRHLPRFLKTHPLIKKWAYLSDLARFEWELLEVFDAADASLLTRERLASLEPAQWSRLQLRLIPASKIISFDWSVDEINKIVKKRICLLFWRQDFKVFYRKLEPLEEILLKAILKKENFEKICLRAAERGDEKSIPQVTALLAGWLDQGLLEDIS